VKKGYLYLVFTSLSILVVLLIAVIFKLSKTTDTQDDRLLASSTKESEKFQNLVDAQGYGDSWVGKISKETNQKTYQYSREKFYIEFN
jgi:hypothetical protein